MSSTSVLTPEAAKFLEEIRRFLSEGHVTSVTISNNSEYTNAGELVKALKKKEKDVRALYREVKDPVWKHAKQIDGEFQPTLELIESRAKAVKSAIKAYIRKLEIEAEEKRREAERIAEERRRELAKKEEAARTKAESYRDAGREDLADKWDGKSEEISQAAEMTEAEAVAAPLPPPKIKGLRLAKTYKGECVDMKALVKWCLDSGMLHLIQVDQKALNAQAKACKGQMEIPGVKWVVE